MNESFKELTLSAKRILLNNSWTKGKCHRITEDGDAYCMLGAYYKAAGLDLTVPIRQKDEAAFAAQSHVLSELRTNLFPILQGYLREHDRKAYKNPIAWMDTTDFNDSPETTFKDVIAVMDRILQ